MTVATRALAAFGALCCGGAVGLAAASMHAVQGHAAVQAAVAAAFALGHGLPLLLLAPTATTRMRLRALAVLAVGTLLFAGTLFAAAFVGTSTAAAPFGGGLLIAGWLVLAFDAARG